MKTGLLLALDLVCISQQLGKKSVLDTEVEAKAFLEVMGKKMHSEGYREPETD